MRGIRGRRRVGRRQIVLYRHPAVRAAQRNGHEGRAGTLCSGRIDKHIGKWYGIETTSELAEWLRFLLQCVGPPAIK